MLGHQTSHEYDPGTFSKFGENVEICPGVVFVKPEKIELYSHILISEFCAIHGGIGTLIGNFIHISSFCSVAGGGLCIMEDFVGLSAGVRIITGTELVNGEGLTNPTIPERYRAVSRSFVHLEKHSFLATNVVVYPGVTVGEGAVIGSNSVVTKDVEPWTINIGTPARRISKRPNDKIKLLESKLYDDYQISALNPEKALAHKKTHCQIPEI